MGSIRGVWRKKFYPESTQDVDNRWSELSKKKKKKEIYLSTDHPDRVRRGYRINSIM